MTFRAFEDRIFGIVATLVLSRPWWIIIGGVILAIAGFVVGSLSISMNAATDDLIAPDVPYMQAYQEFVSEFGDLERLWVVIDAKTSRSDARACANWVEAALVSDEFLGRVYGGISTGEQHAIASRAMPGDELEIIVSACQVLSRLTEADGIVSGLANDLNEGLTGNSLDAVERRHRLEGSVMALSWLIEGPPESTPLPLLSESGRFIFIGVMPPKDYGTLGVIDAPLRRIRGILASARERFPGIELGLTGKPVLQADEMATSDRDMLRAAMLAIVLVGLVIMLVLRTARRPILAMAAFTCAAGWTYGLVGLLVGQLNLLSIVFMLVLIGVGLDFGVHVISRYAEFRRQRGPAGAIRGLYATVMRGNAAAVLTSSATFFVAWFTDFQGLRELGVIAGLGLLLCFIAMGTVLPSLLVVTDRTPRPRLEKLAGTDVGWADQLAHRPIAVLAVACIVSALMIPLAASSSFERNLLELQATGIESARWEHRIMEDSDSAIWFAAAIVGTREDAEQLARSAEGLQTIGRVRSINSLLGPPDAGRQGIRDRLQSCVLEDINVNVDSLDGDLADLDRAVSALVPLSGEDRPILDHLLTKIRGMETEGREAASIIQRNADGLLAFLEEVRRGDSLPLREALPLGARDELISTSGRFLVMLYPRENVWDYQAMGRFIKDVRTVAPDATGVPITHYESLDAMRDAFIRMMILAVLLITMITAVAFRNVLDVFVCLVALGTGLWWTIGAMSLLGVSFNLANFFAAPILVGLGIDGSLHMVHRWREGGPNRLQFGGTRRAVVLTSMTTMIGFGCLLIAEHRGLRSLGIVMALGSAACMIAVVVLLPSLLALRERWIRQ